MPTTLSITLHIFHFENVKFEVKDFDLVLGQNIYKGVGNLNFFRSFWVFTKVPLWVLVHPSLLGWLSQKGYFGQESQRVESRCITVIC
jgi:hypothetical protein